MSRTLHLFGTDWGAMMVPIQVIRWYRMQCYDGTDSCATVVPIRRYCQLYRQVLDIYATSVDYDPRTDASKLFFKIVQNKLHYAAHGHTAAEVIYERADADKPFMGLTTFEGELPAIKDIKIAKNYLKENELKILNNLVSGYFDFAEIMAMEHRPVYMMDYVKQLDTILQSTGRPLLKGSGSISHEEAMDKAIAEYRKYQVKVLTPVEEAYLESINALGKIAKRKGRQSGENH